MEYYEYFSFAQALLKKLHIATNIVKNPEKSINSEIDIGLRAMLFGEENYTNLLGNTFAEVKDAVIYRFFDEYLCNYIFFKIPKQNAFFYIGPFIKVLPENSFIESKSQELSLTPSQIEAFKAYYRNLPIINDENVLISIATTLGDIIWNGENNFDIEYINYEIPDKRKPLPRTESFSAEETLPPSYSLEMIEKNYENENKLLEAVSKGKLNKVNIITTSILYKGTEQRILDPLRNRKNYLIIMNTLLRKAAEQGEVHPYHINKLSSVFAKKIEELYSLESSVQLQKEMIYKYCLLVKEHSLKTHSQLVGKVLTLISYDLSANLTLKHIAAVMNVNASYLSALFKKECGETLTDYVSRKRMETAANTLAHTDKQVQTVAEECGILDVNYFIKIFKRQYRLTPTQYRNEANPKY